MTVQEDVIAVLQDAGLKVYPMAVPNNNAVYPNVVIQTISTRQIRTHDGPLMVRPRMQLSCHGRTYTSCMATAATVQGVVDLNQTDFILATQENQLDAKEVESGIFRVVLDYFIWQGV